MKTLVSKTFSRFAVCCVALFLISAPLFYFVTKHFYAEDMADMIEAFERGEGVPPMDLEKDIMEGVMLQFVLIFAVVSISLYVTMRFITRRLWSPFDDTLLKAESFNIAAGEKPGFRPTDVKEFDRLNRSLSKMMARSRESYRIQKEFTENASHELQTPLAVTRSKLDMLMQEDHDEKTMKLLEDLYSLNTRMGRLNRSLLLLAKIDNGQYSQNDEIEPAAFISERMPSYRLLRPEQAIGLCDRRRTHVSVKANSVLFESLVNNLVVNAIRHSESEADCIEIELTEQGMSVSNPSHHRALDRNALFRRFGSDGTSESGTGLGLAIVKAVCEYHGWKVNYSHEPGRHRFSVDFC